MASFCRSAEPELMVVEFDDGRKITCESTIYSVAQAPYQPDHVVYIIDINLKRFIDCPADQLE